jgi:hypothetical protein
MYLQYNFPASSTDTASNCLIDPRLQAPEDNTDISDIEALTKAKRRGLKPATKVAGVRQTNKKGKKRAHYSDSDIDSDAAPAPKHRGRPKGSLNFSEEDVMKLLDITGKLLPVTAKGWTAVTRKFAKWAEDSNWPARDQRSLEAKFKLVCLHFSFCIPCAHYNCQLVKTKKPTGDGFCPPEVKRAKHID